MPAKAKKKDLLQRAERLVERLEHLVESSPPTVDWSASAFRWHSGRGPLAVEHPHQVRLDDLLCLDRQKSEVIRNTRQFVAGRPANNVLLWGARGTGKSTLIKAVFGAFADQGLRLIEVDKGDLLELPEIAARVSGRPERYLLYCDDLSFDAGERGYQALKATLDGSIAATPENLLLYASSNRRHLLPEYQHENRESRMVDGELHQSEAVEEKISLSERFGLWIAFHPFNQQQYLHIVEHWLVRLGLDAREEVEQARPAALRWALARGSRSGRVAWQFARDWAGRTREERQ